MDKRYFSDKIVEWYREYKRDLPWRQTNDPYKIWVSEIILQQTRVIQGLPYYLKFIGQYPTVEALANAPEQEVLRLWQGLGYYTRARNLHKCAKKVTETYSGKFPNTALELRELPGIGDYTAAAIASIAFKQPVAVVDGNVFRVLSRVFGIDSPINTPSGKKLFSSLAGELVPETGPDLHNQAVMEFGAMFCTPTNPSCDQCFFRSKCFAFKNSMQDQLPVKIQAKKSRKRYFHYLVFKRGKSLLMKKRVEKDIWNGLYDFPLIENDKPVHVKKILNNTGWLKKLAKKDDSIVITDTYKHILTHQTIFCRFVIITEPAKAALSDQSSKFYSFAKISQLPKPVLISRFLDDHAFYS
jgi:A/G-specific adenine glycosylase